MTPILAANWLSISINLLLVIHVIICILLALVVLMQRPKQEGLGAAFGGGLTDQAFGAQTTNVLQKGTVYLGTLFFVVTLVLAILIGKRQASDPSLAESDKAKEEQTETPLSDAVNTKKPEVTPPSEKKNESEEPAESPVQEGEPAEASTPESKESSKGEEPPVEDAAPEQPVDPTGPKKEEVKPAPTPHGGQ